MYNVMGNDRSRVEDKTVEKPVHVRRLSCSEDFLVTNSVTIVQE